MAGTMGGKETVETAQLVEQELALKLLDRQQTHTLEQLQAHVLATFPGRLPGALCCSSRAGGHTTGCRV